MPEHSAPAICLGGDCFAAFGCWFRDGDSLSAFAYLEPGEAADADVLTQLADFRRDQLAHGDGLVLNERLVQQADLFVELCHLAFHYLLDDRRGLASGSGLRAVDIFF